MTALIALGFGRPKRDIIDRAYGKCGLSGGEFDRTPDEMADALRELNVMMMEKPWSGIGFDIPDYGEGDVSDLSCIEDKFVPAVVLELAVRLAANMGASLSPEVLRAYARALSTMRGELASAPDIQMRRGIPVGQGVKGFSRRRFTGDFVPPEPTPVDLSDPGDLVGIAGL